MTDEYPSSLEQSAPREVQLLYQLIERNHKDLVSDLRDMQTQHTAAIQALSSQMRELVQRDVYQAEKTARDERLKRLEDEAAHDRQTARTAMWAGVVAVIAAVVGTVLQVLTKGAH